MHHSQPPEGNDWGKQEVLMVITPSRARLHSGARVHSSSPALSVPLPGLLRVILARVVCLQGSFVTLFSLLHLQFTFPHQRGLFTAPAERAAEGLSAHVTQRKNMRCCFPLQPQSLFNPMQAGSIFKALLFL